MFRKAFLVPFLILLFSVCAYTVEAQTPSASNEVVVNLSPTNPGPFQSVTISVQSFTVNLQVASIEWSVDGKIVAKGVGTDHYTFTTKDIGVPTKLTVFITPVGNVPITKDITVTPMSTDLLWEATDSIVPPLYRGKAMPTSESTLKFVAIPQVKSTNGNLVSSNSFLYNWSEDYNPDQGDSGYGVDHFTATMDYLNPTKEVNVDVTTPDGSVETKADVTITPVNQKLLWYAASPLYGPLFEQALGGTYTVSGSDTSLIAEPYFFSPQSNTSAALTYTWTLNGQALATPPVPNSLFLHRDSTATGSANVGVSIINPSRLFQEASGRLNLLLQ